MAKRAVLALSLLAAVLVITSQDTHGPGLPAPAPAMAASAPEPALSAISDPALRVTVSPATGPSLSPPLSVGLPPAREQAAADTDTKKERRKVTLGDDGRSIELHPGDRFVLALSDGFDWTVTVEDPTVVSRVVDVPPALGIQGVFEARRPGRTTLTATGDPPCSRAQPPCLAPTRLFRVEIVVR